MPIRVPLSRPALGRAEARAVSRAVERRLIVGDGSLGQALERRLSRDLGVRHVLLTTSGTHALELAMASLALSPGDEVILPSFTFPSVANAVLRAGATPVFADIEPETLNLDAADAARRITRKTRALLPAHYAGIADPSALLSLARRKKLFLVEDAAQCAGSSWKGRSLGALGDAGCLSFHATKNVTCGEGGAFLTNNEPLARRAELFREKGTNRTAFFRGEVKKYEWVSLGSSFVLSDILAAVLAEQWARRAGLQKKRAELSALYERELWDLERAGRCRLPVVPRGCRPNHHLFYVLLPDQRRRDRSLARLKSRGIGAAFHFQPLHASPYARKTLGCRSRLPVAESVAGRLLRLPLHPELSRAEVLRVCDEFRKSLR